MEGTLVNFFFAVAFLLQKCHVVDVRNDECEVETLSCFKWKDLFHSLEYSDLLGDIAAYVCYMPVENSFCRQR